MNLPVGGEPSGRQTHIAIFRPSLSPGACLKAPYPGLAPVWSPGNTTPGDIIVLVLSSFIHPLRAGGIFSYLSFNVVDGYI